MRHKWLAVAMVVIAGLGAFGIALTGLGGSMTWLVWLVGVDILASLAFVKHLRWPLIVGSAVLLTLVVSFLLPAGAGWYLVPSAFLALAGALFDLAAPRKQAV